MRQLLYRDYHTIYEDLFCMWLVKPVLKLLVYYHQVCLRIFPMVLKSSIMSQDFEKKSFGSIFFCFQKLTSTKFEVVIYYRT